MLIIQLFADVYTFIHYGHVTIIEILDEITTIVAMLC